MPPRTRIPTASDFASLSPQLTVSLHFPNPPESTTAILLLFHGLGDSEAPFASFARAISLPGVLAISVRGTTPLPPSLLGLDPDPPAAAGRAPAPRHFHWGDDLTLARAGGDALDADPGFDRAAGRVLDRLVRGVLGDECGWLPRDVLLLGFGQGGALALGLASRARMGARVEEVADGERAAGKEDEAAARRRRRAFKGVVSIGGPLPPSMIPSESARPRAETPVLLCCGSASEDLDEDAVDLVRREFVDVEVARWKKADDGMPSNREEMLPIMKFFAERLRDGW